MSKKYYVIGGQYRHHIYGSFDSLHAAKVCATKHEEYWDNWQGWHKPKIYGKDYIDYINNCEYDYAEPYPLYYWDYTVKKWASYIEDK